MDENPCCVVSSPFRCADQTHKKTIENDKSLAYQSYSRGGLSLSELTFLHCLISHFLFWRAGTTPILEKTLREYWGKMKIFHVGSHQFRNRSGSCSENCGFRIAQVVGCHSENGISYSENGISNSESCSENTQELSESSENGLFTPRAFFLKLGWSPGF